MSSSIKISFHTLNLIPGNFRIYSYTLFLEKLLIVRNIYTFIFFTKITFLWSIIKYLIFNEEAISINKTIY